MARRAKPTTADRPTAKSAGKAAAKAGRAPGRATPKGSHAGNRRPGRYTAPIPREVKRSPRWYPWVLLGILVIGVFLIILNYVAALPSSPTNWYTVAGLLAILVGAGMATRYR